MMTSITPFIILLLTGLEASKVSLSDYKCGVRYELAAALKQEGVCKQWKILHPICKKDLEVAYSEAAPYVYVQRESGNVKGVIPG